MTLTMAVTALIKLAKQHGRMSADSAGKLGALLDDGFVRLHALIQLCLETSALQSCHGSITAWYRATFHGYKLRAGTMGQEKDEECAFDGVATEKQSAGQEVILQPAVSYLALRS